MRDLLRFVLHWLSSVVVPGTAAAYIVTATSETRFAATEETEMRFVTETTEVEL